MISREELQELADFAEVLNSMCGPSSGSQLMFDCAVIDGNGETLGVVKWSADADGHAFFPAST